MSYNTNPPTNKTTGQLNKGEKCTKCSKPADSENGSLLCRDHDRIEASQREEDFAIPQPTDAQGNQKTQPYLNAEPFEHDTKRPNCSMSGCEAPSSSASFPCLCPFHLDHFSRPTTEELGIAHCQYPNCTLFWTEEKLLPQGIKLFCKWHAPKVIVYQPEKPQPQPPAPAEYCKVCSEPLFLPSGEGLCGYCWRGIEYGFDSGMGRTINSLGQDQQPSQQQAIPGMGHGFAAFESTPSSCHHLTQEAAQVQQQQQPPHFGRNLTTTPPKTHQLLRLQEQLQNSNSQPPNNEGSQHYGGHHQSHVAQPLRPEDRKRAHGQNERQRLPEGHPHQPSKVTPMERGRQLHGTVPSKETHGQNVQKDQQSPLAGFHGYFGQQQHRNGSDEATGKQQTRQPPPRNAEKLDLGKEKKLHQDLFMKKPQQELSHLSQKQAREEKHMMHEVQNDAEQPPPAEKHAKFWDDYPACKCEGRLLVADTWQTEDHWPKCPLNLSFIPLSDEALSFGRYHRERWKSWAERQIYSMENPGVRICFGSVRKSCMKPLAPKSRYKICDECRKINYELKKRREEREKQKLENKQ